MYCLLDFLREYLPDDASLLPRATAGCAATAGIASLCTPQAAEGVGLLMGHFGLVEPDDAVQGEGADDLLHGSWRGRRSSDSRSGYHKGGQRKSTRRRRSSRRRREAGKRLSHRHRKSRGPKRKSTTRKRKSKISVHQNGEEGCAVMHRKACDVSGVIAMWSSQHPTEDEPPNQPDQEPVEVAHVPEKEAGESATTPAEDEYDFMIVKAKESFIQDLKVSSELQNMSRTTQWDEVKFNGDVKKLTDEINGDVKKLTDEIAKQHAKSQISAEAIGPELWRRVALVAKPHGLGWANYQGLVFVSACNVLRKELPMPNLEKYVKCYSSVGGSDHYEMNRA